MAGPKTKENTQWGRIATDGGAIIPPGQVAGAYNDGKEPLVDAYGRPWVRVVDPSNPSGTPVNYRALIDTLAIVSAVPVLDLQELFCSVTYDVVGAAIPRFPLYLQLYNLAAGPIGAATPEYVFPIMAMDAPISWGPVHITQVFTVGIVAAISLFEPTFGDTGLVGMRSRLYMNFEV